MDYEKKYKEALERARNLHKDAIDMGENIRAKQCEIIFPELKENEDERIRKALIRFHKSTIDIDGIKGADVIAWLEKQGEQNSVWSEEDDAHVNSLLKRLEGLCRNEFTTTRFAINEDEDWLKSLRPQNR